MKSLLLFGLLLVSSVSFSGTTETAKLGEDQISLNNGVNCSGSLDYAAESTGNTVKGITATKESK